MQPTCVKWKVAQYLVNPVDTGLIALFDRSGKANAGHALETAVLQELQRRGKQVNYVRTPAGFEVDLYARGVTSAETLIQVCADLDNPDTLAREVRALQDAAQDWPNATLQINRAQPTHRRRHTAPHTKASGSRLAVKRRYELMRQRSTRIQRASASRAACDASCSNAGAKSSSSLRVSPTSGAIATAFQFDTASITSPKTCSAASGAPRLK